MEEPGVQMATEADIDMQAADLTQDAQQEATTKSQDTVEGAAKDSFRVPFTEYLGSPVVDIIVGSGAHQETLSAHQAFLVKSQLFAEELSRTSEDESTGRRTIRLPEESLAAVGCVLEYLYTGEYFPRLLSSVVGHELESGPSLPDKDDTGDQLLEHAQTYILAERLALKELKQLAHSKIHRVNSSTKAEIVYGRFVYANTPKDDVTIRKPIAAFWAQRSHVLRHEAEEEFRKMCIDFPEFGFDVLSLVLDAKERSSNRDKSKEKDRDRDRDRDRDGRVATPSIDRGASARKRIRQSGQGT